MINTFTENQHQQPPYFFIAAFNMNHDLLGSRLVRIALNFAIDKNAILLNLFNQQRIASFADSLHPLISSRQGMVLYPYNQKRALELFDIAGWRYENNVLYRSSDGKVFEYELLVSQDIPYENDVAELIKKELLHIGINMTIKKISLDKKISSLFRKEYEVSLLAGNAPVDLEKSYTFFHSSQIPNGLNFYCYKNLMVDCLMEEGKVEADQKKRESIITSVKRELYFDPPGIFLFWREKDITLIDPASTPVKPYIPRKEKTDTSANAFYRNR